MLLSALSSDNVLGGVLSVIQMLLNLLFAASWLAMYLKPASGVRLHRISAYCLFVGFLASSLNALYSLYSLSTAVSASGLSGSAEQTAAASVTQSVFIFLAVILAVGLGFEARFFWLRGAVTKNMESCLQDLPWARENAGKAKGYALAFFIIFCALIGLLALLIPVCMMLLNYAAENDVQAYQSLSFGTAWETVLYCAGMLVSGVAMFMEYRFYKGAQPLGL